ncbi:hypothetical protein QOZ80_4AG0312750 [Eleusine coracana subsp. coracana]|nr:hypothetical protein QOZ80_4AG0312750 [Eleusine coracana subsp. coracana]
MANDISLGETLAIAAGGVSISLAIGAGIWAFRAYRAGRLRSKWRRLRLQTLGGVTTLEHKLCYNCAICQYSLAAHEKVRKLSCGHVFHSGKTDKCEETIEKWLFETGMTCPCCRETLRPVFPWEARPPLSAVGSSSTSSSASSLPPLEQSAEEPSSSSATPLPSEEEDSLLEP